MPANLRHLAFALVTPFTSSMVDPVQALIKFLPAADLVFTTVVYVPTVTADKPVSPLIANQSSS